MSSDVILVIVVVSALAFDFTNGFHDTANAIATSVSTRAMSPRFAVALSAVLNFAGAFISLQVAATASERNAPTKLRIAAIVTATRGAIARVEIDVATAFAVSWKPLVKSNARAVPTTMTRMMSASTAGPARSS